jgi:hypothetical protein
MEGGSDWAGVSSLCPATLHIFTAMVRCCLNVHKGACVGNFVPSMARDMGPDGKSLLPPAPLDPFTRAEPMLVSCP